MGFLLVNMSIQFDNMKNELPSTKTIWFNTSSLLLSAVMKIAGNSNNCPWDLFGCGGLFVKIIFKGGGLLGTGG